MLRLVRHGSPDYERVVNLRDRVLRRPLGLTFTPAQLAEEDGEVILADISEGRALASLQFQTHGSGWKMRQVAVEPESQGQGIGSRLVRFSEDWALRKGARSIVLHARDTAVSFYLRLGYQAVGEPFEEVGISHLKMQKCLTAAHGYLDYISAFPTELRETLSTKPLAILPWGALEWHGDHLPAGLDGIVAQEFAKRLASRTGGVLFPTTYLPITTLPHFSSQEVHTQTLRLVLNDLTSGLVKSGFKAALLVSGHYAQGHEWELYDAADRAREKGLLMLAGSPLEVLEDDDLLDHAGRWEAACLDMFRPDLLRLDVLEGRKIRSAEHAVLGETPLNGDPIEGWEKMDLAWTRWASYGTDLLNGEWDEVSHFYQRRREAYRPYKEQFYRTSWEQAIEDWWATKREG